MPGARNLGTSDGAAVVVALVCFAELRGDTSGWPNALSIYAA